MECNKKSRNSFMHIYFLMSLMSCYWCPFAVPYQIQLAVALVTYRILRKWCLTPESSHKRHWVLWLVLSWITHSGRSQIHLLRIHRQPYRKVPMMRSRGFMLTAIVNLTAKWMSHLGSRCFRPSQASVTKVSVHILTATS